MRGQLLGSNVNVARRIGLGVLVFSAMLCGPSEAMAYPQESYASVEDDPSILRLLPTKDTIWPGPQPVQLVDTLVTTDYLVRAGRRVRAWSLVADSAQSYDIAVRSYEIDSYLYVVGPGIVSVDDGHYALTDDDSGDGLDAAMCFRPPKNGRYHVVAAALYGETGEYTLSVKTGCGEDEGDVVVEAGALGTMRRRPALVSLTGGRMWQLSTRLMSEWSIGAGLIRDLRSMTKVDLSEGWQLCCRGEGSMRLT